MNDVERMQADAVMRAKEMYNRRTPSYNTGSINGNIKYQSKQMGAVNAPEKKNEPPQNNSMPQTKTENTTNDLNNNGQSNNFLETLLADKERTLIILLIALLGEEKANAPLLLALMYIIL